MNKFPFSIQFLSLQIFPVRAKSSDRKIFATKSTYSICRRHNRMRNLVKSHQTYIEECNGISPNMWRRNVDLIYLEESFLSVNLT